MVNLWDMEMEQIKVKSVGVEEDRMEDFKKWLCEKADKEHPFTLTNFGINYWEILIKAMWAINRERKYVIQNNEDAFRVYKNGEMLEIFRFKNNSEQQALKASLKYIFEQEK